MGIRFPFKINDFFCLKDTNCTALLPAILFTLLIFYSAPVSSEEKAIPVEVTGHFLEYKNKRQIVIIKGDVVAAYRDWRIECDTLQVNIKKEKLFAYGDVLVIRSDDEITGNFFVYDLKTGEGYIRNAEIHKGVQIIAAKEIIVSPDKIYGKELRQTTCDDLKNPHYRLEVDELINIPDRTNELRGQRLVILGKKVLARGVTISKAQARIPRDPNKAVAPKGQGFSRQKGVFYNLNNQFNLVGNTGDYSANITQKQGTKGSVNLNYNTKNLGSGSMSSNFFNNPARKQTNSSTRLSNAGKIPFYGMLPIISKFITDPSYTFNATYNIDKFSEAAANKELNTDLTIQSKFLGAAMTTKFSKRTDPDGDSNTSDDNLQYINRKPDVNLRLPDFAFLTTGLKFSGDLSYAKLYESRIKKETTKKELNVRFSNPSLDMGPKMKVNFSGSYKNRQYSEGEKQQVAKVALKTTQKWGRGLSSQVNYDLENIKGESPLSFDSRTSRDRLQANLNYQRGKRLNSTLLYFIWDGANNAITNVYQNFRLIQKEDEKRYPWEINLRPTYIVQGKATTFKWKDIKLANMNTQFRVTREKYKLDFNGLYSRDKGKFVNLNSNLAFAINRVTNLALNGRFDTIAKQFTTLDLGINRDYHCFDARFNFNKQREELFLTFNLKAFPEETATFRYDSKSKMFQPRFSTFDSFSQRLRDQSNRLRSGNLANEAQSRFTSSTGVDVR
ncbi:hypothetical protein ACFL35_14455 [Candidatus Riflebacteria bacterium]